MIFRFSLARRQILRTNGLKFQPVSAITTSAVASENAVKTKSNPPTTYPPEFPPPTEKRDFVNFPRPIMAEYAPPVRMGFIPDSWFQFFYPKTGYTGPYVFGGTVLIYLFSKEFIVVEHSLMQCFVLIIFLSIIHLRLGDKIGAYYNKITNDFVETIDDSQESTKKHIRDNIKLLESFSEKKTAIVEITKATTEFIQMQMELAFRERLIELHTKVKNKLDFQAELENVERRVAQKNVMDYVLSNVLKSITPELEKKTMQLCIKDLNSLATRT